MLTAHSDAGQAISVPSDLSNDANQLTTVGVNAEAFDERQNTPGFYLCHLRFSVRIGGKTTWCRLTVPATDMVSHLPLEILEDR